MKTNFPDLERLPKTYFWNHLFWFWWNRPRIFVEDIYEKYILKPKKDKEMTKYNLIIKESELLLKIQLLEMELNLLKTKKKLEK